MRHYSEKIFKNIVSCYVINATAECTTLNDSSIDFIASAQAFHWFNTAETLQEFKRILKPKDSILLIWNNRLTNTEFLKIYEEGVQKYATGYNEINHQNITDKDLEKYFDNKIEKYKFNNFQKFDFSGVIGRLLSCSYTPQEDTDEYAKLYNLIKDAFVKYSINDNISFNYETELYWGKV